MHLRCVPLLPRAPQDSLGAAGTGDVAITVRNAADRVCPVLVAQQAVDVLPTQLLGGAGVRVAASSTLTTANAALVMNVHARITGKGQRDGVVTHALRAMGIRVG